MTVTLPDPNILQRQEDILTLLHLGCFRAFVEAYKQFPEAEVGFYDELRELETLGFLTITEKDPDNKPMAIELNSFGVMEAMTSLRKMGIIG